ncbi:LolA-related protein [Herminiimonas fonticola]|uniref:LolA-related protein n=1 Tax=Herminiimonas fonticola TaxID=303380 RepID=UPI0033413C33
MRKSIGLRAVVLAFFLAGSCAVHAANITMDQLMAGLAQAKPAKVNFTEKKYIAQLDRPVESSGEMLFTPPDRLEKRTFKPKPERMVLDRDTLVLERGKNKYTMQLGDSPELAALIESIRATLAGDRRSLEFNFIVALQGPRENWSMTLTPSNNEAQQKVKRIRLSGSNSEVREIEVLQGDGDRSVTTIEKIKP